MRKFTLFFLLSSTIFLVNCQEKKSFVNTIITGAERTEEYIPLLKDKKVGMVVNHSSKIGNIHLLDTLLLLGIDLKVIFSPEHGFGGKGDAGEYISDKKEDKTGIKIISLYSKKRKPVPEDMKGLDYILFDIQDVGVRFYTYISTLHFVMEACAEAGIPVLLLDRPNPLGYYVDGPVLEPNYQSFLGMHPIPLVYGLTIGELANMINNEGWLKDGIKCCLKVIECENYDHKSFYNLPVNPSPNLRNMKAVYQYPTTGLFVGTEMSLGHGTDIPYLTLGHPEFPDQSFSFVPHPGYGAKDPKFNGQICYGIDLSNAPADSLRQINKIDIGFIQKIYNKMNIGNDFFNSSFNYHAGNKTLKVQIMDGISPEDIRKSWETGIEDYKKTRKKYLLYPDFE